MKYTVEEVRAHARMLRECWINAETTRDRQQDKLADICDAYADLLERIGADDRVVKNIIHSKPFGYAYRYADGIKIGGDGRERNGMRPIEAIPLFTYPPAQAAQVDKPPRLGGCCCGEPCTLGVVHRTDGPCFHYVEPTAEPVAQGEAVVTSYRDELLLLESRKCPTCRGLGKCDDAEPGDISCREWVCPDCNGSGLTTKQADR